MEAYMYPLLVFIAMGAWGAIHSWLAAFSTKRMARKVFGSGIDRYYRLIFVGAAVLTLLPILGMVAFLPSRTLWVIPAPWVFVTTLVQVLAIAALMVTVMQTDPLTFIGLRQASQPDLEHENKLVKTGFYRLVRHPLYLFSIIAFWLFPYVTDLILAFILAGTLYFLIGLIPEERKLVETFGEEYEQYHRDVPALIPFLKHKQK
jgi:protein-S-isoprenylcysteine O-methyltransferase Ste14